MGDFTSDIELLKKTMLLAERSKSLYLRFVSQLVEYAVGVNDAGVNFPIWGTCLGFESLLLVLSGFETQLAVGLEDRNYLHPVTFDRSKHSIFNKVFDEKTFASLETTPMLYFHHDYGFLYKQTIDDPYVKENINVLAKASTEKGAEVIAAYQHKRYPFVAVQHHPEKIQFAYTETNVLNKSAHATAVGRKHARALRLMLEGLGSSASNQLIAQYKQNMRQEFDDGNQAEVVYFDRGFLL